MAETRRTDQRLTAAEKRAQVVALRRNRASFEEIGRALGISKQRAWALYQKALAEVPRAQLEAHIAEELELIDAAIADLLILARGHSRPRYAVESWNCVCRFMERKARMLGIDAPTKARVAIITEEMIESEIARVQAKLNAMDAAPAAGEAMPPAQKPLALPPGEWTSENY